MDWSTIKPLFDNILVKCHAKEKTLESGIILPDFVDDHSTEVGVVVAAGKGLISDKNGELDEMQVYAGDTVYFHGSTSIKLDDTYYLVKEDSVVAVKRKGS